MSLKSIVGLPFETSASVDQRLPNEAAGSVRRAVTRDLGGISSKVVSLGGKGTVTVVPCAIVAPIQYGRVAKRRGGRELVKLYQKGGVATIIGSKAYKKALDRVEACLVDAATEVETVGDLDTALLFRQLVRDDSTVRDVAVKLHKVHQWVDAKLPEMTTTAGRLVRFEGSEALVVVERDGVEVLRHLEADDLRKAGVTEEGAAFLHTTLRGGGASLSYVQPAVDLDADDEEALVAAMAEGSTPVPAGGMPR